MRIEVPPKRRRPTSLTPLIDVVFLLLVFFMLVSRLVDLQAIGLDVPSAEGSDNGLEGTVLVRILEHGEVDLNGVPLTLTELQTQIQGTLLQDPQQRIVVRPASSVPLQRLVEVLDRLHLAGTTHVILIEASTRRP